LARGSGNLFGGYVLAKSRVGGLLYVTMRIGARWDAPFDRQQEPQHALA